MSRRTVAMARLGAHRPLPAGSVFRLHRVKGARPAALDPAPAKDNANGTGTTDDSVRGCVDVHHARDGERKDGSGGVGRRRWVGSDSPIRAGGPER